MIPAKNLIAGLVVVLATPYDWYGGGGQTLHFFFSFFGLLGVDEPPP